MVHRTLTVRAYRLDMASDVRSTGALARIPWVTALTLMLPLVGLGLLLARPELDIEWHHEPSHFWLVLVAAAVNAALAYVTNSPRDGIATLGSC